jgi:hypothetical protein
MAADIHGRGVAPPARDAFCCFVKLPAFAFAASPGLSLARRRS